jgi:uncharacterized membrane protein YfcA
VASLDLSSISAWLIAFVLLAISLGALFKGMTGLGLPMFAVPAIATITSVEEAVILMIIPGIAANVWLVANHRRYASSLREHLPFLFGGFAGGIVGTVLLVLIDDRWLKLVLAAWLMLYLIQYFLGDLLKSLFRTRGFGAAAVGLVGGTIQGASGVSAHIVAPYFHDPRIKPEPYAFLVASAFLVFSIAQLSGAIGTNLFTPERVALGAMALVPTLIFTRLGIALAGKISPAVFNRILLVTFLIMEIKLLSDVL